MHRLEFAGCFDDDDAPHEEENTSDEQKLNFVLVFT